MIGLGVASVTAAHFRSRLWLRLVMAVSTLVVAVLWYTVFVPLLPAVGSRVACWFILPLLILIRVRNWPRTEERMIQSCQGWGYYAQLAGFLFAAGYFAYVLS